MLHFLKERKFIGGDKPSIADYMFVPVLTMFEASPYADEMDERIRTWINDFKAASKSWEETAGMQTWFINSKKA